MYRVVARGVKKKEKQEGRVVANHAFGGYMCSFGHHIWFSNS